jgi:hypothetical protein
MLNSSSRGVSVAVPAAQAILTLYRKVTIQHYIRYVEVPIERPHQFHLRFRDGALKLEFRCFGFTLAAQDRFFMFHVRILPAST